VEFGQVDAKVFDRLAGQRDDAGLVAFAGEPDMPGTTAALELILAE
jgi:hypothetical protein